jgi:hypothetical protein
VLLQTASLDFLNIKEKEDQEETCIVKDLVLNFLYWYAFLIYLILLCYYIIISAIEAMIRAIP